MRRTLSSSASRSMAGTAHSSPMRRGDTAWNAAMKRSQVLQVYPALRVGDEGDGQLVDARIPRQRPARQLGELTVVAGGQGLVHLADVLLHHVHVVQQPLTRRTHVQVAVGARRQPRVGVVQQGARLGQAGQQRRAAPAAGRFGQVLPAGDGRRGLGELVGPQQLAADGAREKLVPPRTCRAGEEGANAERGYRRAIIGQKLPSD